jgi:hypothetical protein
LIRREESTLAGEIASCVLSGDFERQPVTHESNKLTARLGNNLRHMNPPGAIREEAAPIDAILSPPANSGFQDLSQTGKSMVIGKDPDS